MDCRSCQFWTLEDIKLSMYTRTADQVFAQILRIPMDNIFAQYCMLIITAFTPFCCFSVCFFLLLFFFFFFFCFHLGWGRPVCARVWICVCVRVSVSIGEGLKEKIIPNFLMYCFCSPAPLLLYHFKF